MNDRWNLTQTWAWIRWRNAAKVASFAQEAHIGLAEAMMYPDGTRIIEEEHRRSLLEALRAGRITTSGVPVGGQTVIAVPAEAWQVIEPVAPSEARHAVPGNRRVAWRGLSFLPADVTRLWPGGGVSLTA